MYQGSTRSYTLQRILRSLGTCSRAGRPLRPAHPTAIGVSVPDWQSASRGMTFCSGEQGQRSALMWAMSSARPASFLSGDHAFGTRSPHPQPPKSKNSICNT